MSAGKKPQDRRPGVSQMLNNAISLQGANILQKNALDMMATKIILSLKLNKDVQDHIPKRTTGVAADLAEAWNEQHRILGMTRDECRDARDLKTINYQDERIQEIITKATDEIAAILLENVG